MAERSKPPSVGWHSATRPNRCRATLSVRTCTGEGSPFQPFSPVAREVRRTSLLTVSPFAVTWQSHVLRGSRRFASRRRCRPASLGGLTPPRFPGSRRSLGVRTPHRSGRGVSFLFQSRRSPAPDLRPVTCPRGGGTFLMSLARDDAAAPSRGPGHGSQSLSASRTYATGAPKPFGPDRPPRKHTTGAGRIRSLFDRTIKSVEARFCRTVRSF